MISVFKQSMLNICYPHLPVFKSSLGINSIRLISLNSAISSGIRNTKIASDKGFVERRTENSSPRKLRERLVRYQGNTRRPAQRKRDFEGSGGRHSTKSLSEGFSQNIGGKQWADIQHTRGHGRFEEPLPQGNPKIHRTSDRADKQWNKGQQKQAHRVLRADRRDRRDAQIRDRPSAATGLMKRQSSVPPSGIPYSTPASQFIYGTSAVEAAIRCGRRKLYKLYIYEPDGAKTFEQTQWGEPKMRTLSKLASVAGAQVKHVSGAWGAMLDKMSESRPHNGVVIEASPLPNIPVTSFQHVASASESQFSLNVGPQDAEEASINRTENDSIPFASHRATVSPSDASGDGPRYPFTLLLDGVVNSGNVGSIIRSAYYFGVDAIVFSSRNSAPISPVVMKTSAGACENIPFLSVRDIPSFIQKSQANGWKFYAAEAPSATQNIRTQPIIPTLKTLSSKLRESPCVLMLGNEDAGLSGKIKSRADAFISIPGVYSTGAFEDIANISSLNVGVASALLCEAFLCRPVIGAHNTEATFNNSTSDSDLENRIF
ncbi:hypothetical protein FQN57_006435 [Myotisia sp. PD_48]|nr:hypothetical protein FQN57_006435 [Myotisia sp. PD_48]